LQIAALFAVDRRTLNRRLQFVVCSCQRERKRVHARLSALERRDARRGGGSKPSQPLPEV
jgi:hypothetical protein